MPNNNTKKELPQKSLTINSDTTILELRQLIGKNGRYNTAHGKSQINRVEQFIITADDVILVLYENKPFSSKKRRRIKQFEFAEDEESTKQT